MNNNFDSIAELLPEGLSESAVNEICNLVETVIVKEVEDKINDLDARVHSFLRLKMDDLKEQALTELMEENEVLHNSRMYEQIKSIMSIELTEEDDKTALATLMKESSEVAEERDIVIDEFNKALHDNKNLVLSNKNLIDKIETLEEEKSYLEEEVTLMHDAKEKPFKSSEQAKMITADVDQPIKETHPNEFLTEEVMKFMPFNNS